MLCERERFVFLVMKLKQQDVKTTARDLKKHNNKLNLVQSSDGNILWVISFKTIQNGISFLGEKKRKYVWK